MAAGDIYVRRNGSDTSTVPNAGTNEDSGWDVVVINTNDIVTYTDPNFQLDIGLYLIMYSEFFETPDTTNNERIEIQGEIHTGAGVQGGYGQGYIRVGQNGHQECVVRSQMILDVTADNTDVFVRFYRTDNSTDNQVARVPGKGSVIILELDDTDNYGFYSTSSSEATSGATVRTLNLDTNDRQDTGFSRSGTDVTVSNAGRYLAMFNMDISQTATGREDVIGQLLANGSEIEGAHAFCYLRGADGTQDGALSWIGIVDLAANDVLSVDWNCPTNATITAAAGATLQLWQIPAGADEAIMEATTGDYNAAADFTWDTLPHIDTASFTATAGNSNIDVDQQDYVLAFATFHQDAPDSVQRGSPEVAFKVNDVVSDLARGDVYHRNSGGTGITSVTVASILSPLSGQSIEVRTDPKAATGSMNNDSGQFALLSLESLFGPYTFPPVIDNFNGGTNAFLWGATGLVISGSNFGATQGTGSVEIWDDTVGTTVSVQTIDSWSDTSITIDTVQGSLPDNTTVYIVVTIDGGTESLPFAVSVGLEDYTTLVEDLSPDHLWKLNNVFTDTGITGPQRDMNVGTVGTAVFVTDQIAEDTTHAWHLNAVTVRREITDSDNMNITNTLDERTIACWIQVNGIQQAMSCIWKEGGGVQNLAFIMGIGNVLIAQLADVAGSRDNVQAFSDFRLTPNRPYHIAMRYSQSENPSEMRLFIDGEEQQTTDGNPMTINIFDTHSGDVVWGDPDNNLETGGTDISYNGPEDAYLAFFATWSDNSANKGNLNKVDEIRDVLFRRGAVPDTTLSSGTAAAMQTALDALADTTIPDWPLGIRVEAPTDGSDLTLTADNVVFDDRITLDLEWRGAGTLTWINSNGGNLDANSVWSPTGGTIVVQETVQITVTVLDATDNSVVEGARVYLFVNGAIGPYADGEVLLNADTNASGVAAADFVYVGTDPVVSGRVRKGSSSTFYKTGAIAGTVTSTGFAVTVLIIRDE